MVLVLSFALFIFVSNFGLYKSQTLVCDAETEHYAESVSACPRTCNNPRGPLCMAIIRKPSCVCNEGTVRDTVNNRCVALENCPKTNIIEDPTNEYYAEIVCAAENEVYAASRSACPTTCQNRRVRRSCTAIIVEPSCVCKTGTIRDTVSGKCVEPANCSV